MTSTIENRSLRQKCFHFRYFIYFKEFGSYNKQIRVVKSRSNSRGSILEDYTANRPDTNRASLSLSLAAVLGNTDYDHVLGSSPGSNTSSGYHKIHESTCKCSWFARVAIDKFIALINRSSSSHGGKNFLIFGQTMDVRRNIIIEVIA